MNKKILVGSAYFFEGMEGYKGKDKDFVIFEKNPSIYNFYFQQKRRDEDIFKWNIDNVFNYNHANNPMSVGKYLVPEVLKELGKEWDDVKSIVEAHLSNLEPRHKYLEVVYQSYEKNGKMKLLKKQREEAFEVYQLSKEKR